MTATPDLYQAFLGDSQKRHISPAAIPLELGGDTGNEDREYELFRGLQRDRGANCGPWGMVSWKFENKTLVPVERFHAFAADRLAAGDDCVFINPMIGQAAVYWNVWEQWGFGNDNIPRLCAFLGSLGEVSYSAPMGEDTFAFCNYFIATSRFWKAYFQFVDRFIDRLEQEKAAGSPVGRFYGGSANYYRNMKLTKKPFIIERLFSSFLASDPGLRRSAFPWAPEDYVVRFGKPLGEILCHVAELKRRVIAGDRDAFTRWNELRHQLLHTVRFPILQLDDLSDLQTVIDLDWAKS